MALTSPSVADCIFAFSPASPPAGPTSDPRVPPPNTQHFPFLVCHAFLMHHILIMLLYTCACVAQLLIMCISKCLHKYGCPEAKSLILDCNIIFFASNITLFESFSFRRQVKIICACGTYPLGRIIFCSSFVGYNKAL